jgi:hypothetical protein
MPQGSGAKFALPKIGGVMGGGRRHPFGEGVNQSHQGKMTPMYEKQ